MATLRPAPNPLDSAGLEALDDIFLSAMILLQEFFQIRAKLAQTLKLGYHLLAKARYVMGNKRIGSAQLPGSGETITATTTVMSHLPTDSDCYFFNLCTENSLESPKAGETAGPVLRGTTMAEKEEKNEKPRAPANTDPLRWFGVLVPQELRLAQSTFKKAIELSIEVTNLQMKIEHTSQQFWSIINSATSILYEDEP